VLVVVQNLPVPFDRRVWLESRSLHAVGYDVTVVCPKGPGDPSYAEIDGISVYKYRPYSPGGSKASFVVEYVYSFLLTAWLALRARRRGRFVALQACNPPDIFWPLALLLRRLDGTRFVFDHHDLCPELYESRFAGAPRLPYLGLRWLERRTHRVADHVIATNESYRHVALTRSGKQADDVTVVRTGPDPERLRPVAADPGLRRGRRYLVAYLGVMGPQDGVDVVVRAADLIVNTWGRQDVAFVLVGGGDCYAELVQMRDAAGLADHVTFTGRVPDPDVAAVLSTADVALCPDPKNPLNDVSTMNKTMEYMAFGLPVVAFDLRETRVSAQDAAVYVDPDEGVEGFARAVLDLLADPARRAAMGAYGRARIVDELSWRHQEERYLRVYADVVGRPEAGPADTSPAAAAAANAPAVPRPRTGTDAPVPPAVPGAVD
jgi:glycosyltransferase involved in cell wall biosynthesis